MYPLTNYDPETGEADCEACGLRVHYASMIELPEGGLVRCLECQDNWQPCEGNTVKEVIQCLDSCLL